MPQFQYLHRDSRQIVPNNRLKHSSSSSLRCRFGRRHGILQHKNNRIPSQEHLGDVSILVDGLGFLSLASLGDFVPHLLHVFQHHVTVTVEGLHTTQEFAVVATVDEDLSVVLHRRHENRQRSCLEFFLLSLFEFFERQF